MTTARTGPHSPHATNSNADPSWQFLVENLPDAVALLNREGVILLSNGRLCSSLSPVEAGASVFEYLPPQCREHFAQSLAAAFQTGQPQYFQMEEADAQGTATRHATRIQPVDQDGQVVNAIVITTDIPRFKGEDDAASEMPGPEASSDLYPLAELAAGLSHEVNNPLAVVQGYAEILLDSALPPGLLEHVESIHAAARRASRIVSDLNRLAGYGPPTRFPVNLKALVEQLINRKEAELAGQKVEVTTQFPADLPPVLVDPYQVMEALLNILNNAQQAVTRAQSAGSVDARAWVRGGQVGLSIIDNGPGIAPENLDRVFEPFFTIPPTGNGPGLGLSISRAIIRQNGGDLWAESSPGWGATFHLQLPAHLAP